MGPGSWVRNPPPPPPKKKNPGYGPEEVIWLSKVPLPPILGYHVTAAPSCRSRYSPRYHGYCRQPSTCTGATLRSGCDGDPTTICCVGDSGLSAIPEPVAPTLSRKVLYDMVGDTPRARKLFPLLDKMLEDAGLSKVKGIIPAFLAQVWSSKIVKHTLNIVAIEFWYFGIFSFLALLHF